MNKARRIASCVWGVVCAWLAVGLAGAPARAELGDLGKENQPIHASADREVWNRKKGQVELFGHAAVRQPGESITADYILLDQNARTLTAKGNCVYIARGTVIYGAEMHFNLETRTGTIIGGRVANEQFTLAGERINKMGDGHFQTHWGEYSTCQDCVQSWTLMARDVDMQVEGYAYLNEVMIKVKDAPAAWLPYLVMPMKTRRQSGLLFPSISFQQQNGWMVVIPWFWAINRSSDMTFGFGRYTHRGWRLEWEGRYALSARSGGKANLNYLRDSAFDPQNPNGNTTGRSFNRWSLSVAQGQELPFGIDQKLKISEVSDNRYPELGDMTLGGEAYLSSIMSFSYASSDVSAFVAGRRIRNLLYIDPNSQNGQEDARTFDRGTVQPFPSAVVTTNDRFILGTPIAAGLSLGLTNFARQDRFFDQDVLQPVQYSAGGARVCPDGQPADINGYCAGFDPIRKATRFSLTPTLYSTVNPVEGVSIVPSLRYYYYFYNFPDQQSVPILHRGYLLFQTDLMAQFERIFDTKNADVPRVKHLIRPLLTYSWIPPGFISEARDHPFLSQIRYASDNHFSGYNFDNYDIVPINESQTGTNYFTPLGHSLTYGFSTQLVRRKGALDSRSLASYDTPAELIMGQTVNFKAEDRKFGRLFSQLNLNFDSQITASATHYYYPYQPGLKHTLSTNFTYIMERGVKQGVLAFDRSFSLGFTMDPVVGNGCSAGGCYSLFDPRSVFSGNAGISYSLSDYILPSFSANYNFVQHQFLGGAVGVSFQSPSRCWKIDLGATYAPFQTNVWVMRFDASINLTGSGFGGISEIAAKQMAPK